MNKILRLSHQEPDVHPHGRRLAKNIKQLGVGERYWVVDRRTGDHCKIEAETCARVPKLIPEKSLRGRGYLRRSDVIIVSDRKELDHIAKRVRDEIIRDRVASPDGTDHSRPVDGFSRAAPIAELETSKSVH